ncbi:MAG: FkbM family methyltransferase [Geminicoccaceae bacterium]
MPDRLAGALGFARSLAIYYGQPWRNRALRRHYAAFVGPDDLAFDVGAHVGNHARCLARLGARVLAIEPQPAFAGWLRWLFRDQPRVTVIERALAAAPGVVELYRSPRTPTVATTSHAWIEKVRASAGFERVRWAQAIEVPAVTLDALIARHGLPRLCKIDVEGYETEVLRGLSRPIPVVTFEYLPAAVDVAAGAAALLAALGPYRFNLTLGERRRFLWLDWRSLAGLEAWLAARHPDQASGDVHARLDA